MVMSEYVAMYRYQNARFGEITHFLHTGGLFILAAVFLASRPVGAQVNTASAVVTVDDSPTARQFYQEALAQTIGNPERAAELIMDLLDEYPRRVLGENDEDPNVFLSVRALVISLLQSNSELLKEYQSTASTSANTLLESMLLEEAFESRPLTASGFEAGLRIAQRRMETGSFGSALQTLDEIEAWDHLEEQSLRIQVVRSLAAGFAVIESTGLERDELIDVRDQALAEIAKKDVALVEQLQEVLNTAGEYTSTLSVGSTEKTLAKIESIDNENWARIWTNELFDTLFRRRYLDPQTGQPTSKSRADRALQAGSSMTSVPVAVGDTILVNEGLLIRAWDRLTGRTIWSHSFGNSVGLRPSGLVGDLGEIVVSGDAAITVVGHAFGSDRDGSGEVVRFNPETGEERWRIRPDRFSGEQDLKGAFVSGPPVIHGDVVFLPLRKVNTRLETIEFVIAIDLDLGVPRWVQPLGSSGGVRMGSSRPFFRLAILDGDVIVCSPVGVAARLDGRTGRPLWLRTFEIPLRSPQGNAQPWQIGGPVLLRIGIASISPSLNEWILLNPETGDLLQTNPLGVGTPLGAPKYLLGTEYDQTGKELLIGVGSDLNAIDTVNPRERLWSYLLDNSAASADAFSSGLKLIRGRVQVTSDGLAVPTSGGLALVSLADGEIDGIIGDGSIGNPLVYENQVFLAGDLSLSAFMSLDNAVQTLRIRLREDPENVEQGIALLELARRSGNTTLAIEACELCVSGLSSQNNDEIRRDVLNQILGALEDDFLPLEDADRFHAFAAQIALSPEENVKRLLARGDWSIKHDQLRKAVESWREILKSDELSSVRVMELGRLNMPASKSAYTRIKNARDRDPAIANSLDREDSAALKSALNNRFTADQLASVIRSVANPSLTRSAVERAVEILRDEGRVLECAGLARSEARRMNSSHASTLLNIAASAALEDGRPSLAAQLLRESGADQARIDQIESSNFWPIVTPSASEERPVISGAAVPSSVTRLGGQIVEYSDEAQLNGPSDRVYIQRFGKLIALDSAGLKDVWSYSVEDPDVKIIRHEPDLLIYQFGTQHTPRLSALSPEDGVERWKIEKLDQLLPPMKDPTINPEGTKPDNTPFLPWEITPITTDQGLALVRGDGAVSMVKLGQAESPNVLWQHEEVMDRVYGTHWDGGALHLWGNVILDNSRTGKDVRAAVVSIDPVDGRILHTEVLENARPVWVAGIEGGRLAVGTYRSISVLDPLALNPVFRRSWTHSGFEAVDTRHGWSSLGKLVAVDQSGSPIAWELTDGQVEPGIWLLPQEPGWQPREMINVSRLDDLWLIHFSDRLVVFDAEGELKGADSLSHLDRGDWRALVGKEELVLISLKPTTGKYTCLINRLNPKTGLRIVGDAFEVSPPGRSYETARIIDGWLLLGAAKEFDAIPLLPAGDG